jgi:molybdate transport system substrate-binding protein
MFDLSIVSSGAFAPAWKVLLPMFEQQSGLKLQSQAGASVGDAPTAVPRRLARGEDIDVVIMSGPALAHMMAAGFVSARQDLALSRIGLAVQAGAAVPDIATPEALTTVLLGAGRIALSRSVSGVYVQERLLARLGIAEAVSERLVFAAGEPAGAILARGEADVALQQVSELKPVAGITLVGPIAEDVQLATMFAAGLVASSTRAETGLALMRFLVSGAARGAIEASGMDPVG